MDSITDLKQNIINILRLKSHSELNINKYIKDLSEDLTSKKKFDSLVKLSNINEVDGSDKNILEQIKSDMPLQYITGISHFFGYKYFINQNVLIPRPETEELVYTVIKAIKKEKKLNILDIGTGSGCIPNTLANEMPTHHYTAIDVSIEALKIAALNAKYYDNKISFYNMDFLLEKHHRCIGNFDIIISNPPYIPMKEKYLMKKNVLKFEPFTALFVEDKNPLIFYYKIISFAKDFLNKSGTVFLELNEFNSKQVETIYKEHFDKVRLIKDMQGKNRILKASHLKL